MKQRWLIDGHNVIHARRGLRDLLSKDSSGALSQRKLIDDVHLITDIAGDEVWVAFDSRHFKSLSEKWRAEQESAGIRVSYGSADEQADTLIERWVLAALEPDKIIVVTNDLAIRSLVEAAGAFSISVSEFAERLRALVGVQQRKIERQNNQASDDFRNEIPL
ncbi:MAG: NYN domain-containing protein [Verrucomicrobiota bacterium]